jgi:succinyl-CoA synthetase alpha subunit
VSILVDENTKLVVQGVTGREGQFHTLRNKAYGTNVVAGVTPGKAGQDVDGIPVFNTVRDAVEATGANTSMIFVPPRFATDAIFESLDAGIDLTITITEGIPAHDMMRVYTHLKRGDQISKEIGDMGIGQSTVVGIGGDPIVGSSFIDVLAMFEADPDTDLVVMVGEIGGDEEEKAGAFIAENMSTPVVGYIAGFQAPPGKQMGHAGAIITGSSGTAQGKKDALEALGVRVGTNPTEVAEIVADTLK